MPFAFKAGLESGGTYTVSVSASPNTPISQTCSVTAGTGTITIGTLSITSVRINCSPNSFAVGGSVNGLVTGESVGMSLVTSATQTATVTAPAPSYAFGAVLSGTTYTLAITNNPNNKICTFDSGMSSVTNTIVNLPVNALVTCATSTIDTTPDPFSFTAKVNVALSTQATSNSITVSGINTAAPISITGASGEYSINGGAFTNIAGTVNNTQTVIVRQTSSASAGTVSTVTLNIGGVSAGFDVTTVPAFTVTANAGANGNISPTSVTVNQGASVSFNLTPNTGYSIASVSSSPCGGALSGSTYVAGPITANCTVTASFVASSYTVSVVVSGLTSGGLVLQKDLGETLTIGTVGTYAFVAQVPTGSTYSLAITANPTGQSCLFTNGTGATTGDVTNIPVAVTCKANPTYTSKFNDTGVTANQCYQDFYDVLVACNSAAAIALYPAQDGMIGRDVGATNGNTDGKLGFSFSSVSGGCVQDNNTGLMWEVKTTDGGLRDWTKVYTNYSAVYNPASLYGTATDASGFVTAVNAATLCGFGDWRLPTRDELQSIVDYGVATPGPTVDATWFPNTQGDVFWSASPYVVFSPYAWLVSFGNGYVYGQYYRYLTYYVRLVRAGQ